MHTSSSNKISIKRMTSATVTNINLRIYKRNNRMFENIIKKFNLIDLENSLNFISWPKIIYELHHDCSALG